MNSRESSRNWPDAIMASADVGLHDRGPGSEESTLGAQATGWDPAEVWLSRIKRPRDRAAISLAACLSNATS